MNLLDETRLTSLAAPAYHGTRFLVTPRWRRRTRHDSPLDDPARCEADLLGGTRLDADARARHLALWRKYALPRTHCSQRHAIHPRLRNRAAHARKSLDRKSR